MNIEQRAHEAAMSNLQSRGGLAPQESAQAYQKVYESIVQADMAATLTRCGGYEKALESAVTMAKLHEQGMAAMSMMELRAERNRLKDQIEDGKKNGRVIEITNMVVCAMGGFAVAMILVWLK